MQHRWLHKLVALIARLDLYDGDFSCESAFAPMVGHGSETKYPSLSADRVDVLDECGKIDPMPSLNSESVLIVSDPKLMFPDGTNELPRVVGFCGGDIHEYIALLLRQLWARKVGLVGAANAAAGTFAVGKKTGRQREVWDGSAISIAASPPPKSPLQADPGSLIHLECSQVKPLVVAAGC